MSRTPVSIFVFAASVALLLPGCDGATGQVCTEIGCSDGLFVTLRAAPGGEYTLTATAATGEDRNGRCVITSDGSCLVGFPGFLPDEVTLAVSGDGQQASVTLEPDYEQFQPNGPGCPPVCRQASVEIDLESP